MAAQNAKSVRIGPISLLTLISVLLLAVLAMLCVTTSNAADAMSRRQSASVTGTYELESCGQAALAGIDEHLKGATGNASTAAADIEAVGSSIAADAVATCRDKNLTVDISAQDADIVLTVSDSDGRRLDARVTVSDNLTHSITQWKVTSTHESEQQGLWSGNGSSN